jgi:hypothetical protein
MQSDIVGKPRFARGGVTIQEGYGPICWRMKILYIFILMGLAITVKERTNGLARKVEA